MLAAKRGILINNPKSLEEINKIRIVAFDKTGTITSEKMSVAKIHGDKQFASIAAGLEKDVHHPIAQAIANYSKANKVSNIQYLENVGVKGDFKDKEYVIKRYEGQAFKVNDLNTNVALYKNDKPMLVYELQNDVKDGVIETIKVLQKLKIKTVMISGDKKEVAQNIGQQIGIDEVYADVSPINKASIIKKLQKQGKTAFVGDGFNDAIAIRQSNLSFAFSKGSDIANSLSDVSFLTDDFTELISFFTLGKLNSFRVRLSLSYAFGFNAIVIPIAFLLLVQP